MIYLGFDPGFSGAWGMIDHNGEFVACGDMIHNGSRILTSKVWEDVVKARDGEDMEIVIELVASMPKQGVSSTFKFGMAFGATIAIAERFNVPFHLVVPRVWKKAMELDSDKDKSLSLARDLWPSAPLTRKKDNGRAEALLLAEWLRRQA